MNMIEAIDSAFKRYADFSGRSRRSEYWWFFLFVLIIDIVATVIDSAFGFPLFRIIAFLALIVPGVANSIRRLHDTDRSGWWLLIAFVPLVGAIALIVFYCQDGIAGPNRYGPSPKGQIAPPQWGQPAA